MVLWKFPEEVLPVVSASSFKALFLKDQSKFLVLNEVGHGPTRKHFTSRVMQLDNIKLAVSLILRVALLLQTFMHMDSFLHSE